MDLTTMRSSPQPRVGHFARESRRSRQTICVADTYLLEFLDLKDAYSEGQVEEALVNRIQEFLLELGGDFAFMGRQRRLRIGDTWLRIDLLFFHRRLRCLVIVDLKRGELSSGGAGQMNVYCNYARELWMLEGENPPVGLVLCTKKNAALAHYAFEGLGSKARRRRTRRRAPRAVDRSRGDAVDDALSAPAHLGAMLPPWPSARSPRSDIRCSASARAR